MTINFRVEGGDVGYSLYITGKDGVENLVFSSSGEEDLVLLSYLIDKASRDTVDGEEFSKFIIDNHDKFPFMIIPKE